MKTDKQLGELIAAICDDVKHGTTRMATNRLIKLQLEGFSDGMGVAFRISDEEPQKITTAKAVRAIKIQMDELRELLGK